jgi:hypothetical protein
MSHINKFLVSLLLLLLVGNVYLYAEYRELSNQRTADVLVLNSIVTDQRIPNQSVPVSEQPEPQFDSNVPETPLAITELQYEQLVTARQALADLETRLTEAENKANPSFEELKAAALLKLEQQYQAHLRQSPMLRMLEELPTTSRSSIMDQMRTRKELIYNSFFDKLALSPAIREQVSSMLTERDGHQFARMDGRPVTNEQVKTTREIFANVLNQEQLQEFDDWNRELTYKQSETRARSSINMMAGPISDTASRVLLSGYTALLEKNAVQSASESFGEVISTQTSEELIELRNWVASQVSPDEMLAVDVFIENLLVRTQQFESRQSSQKGM